MPAQWVNRATYAAHIGVSGGAVTRMIDRGALTALSDDGKLVDVERADRQLHAAIARVRRRAENAPHRAPRPRVPRLVDEDGSRRRAISEDRAAQARAELWARIIADFERSFFGPAIAACSLSYSQAEQLERCWYRFRRRASRKAAEAA